jgi:hypothetical protein
MVSIKKDVIFCNVFKITSVKRFIYIYNTILSICILAEIVRIHFNFKTN